jgi:glycosyltransferase involved in cell wall biosynthesis
MTSHTESFGLVLIEAQAMGVPCVAYDSAQGACEILTDGENGFLIPRRDREEMVRVVGRMMEDSALRAEIGRKGKENAARYSAEQIEKQWKDFIDSL